MIRIVDVLFLGDKAGLHDCRGIRDMNFAGAEDADRLEVLGPPDAAEPALAGTVAGIMNERAVYGVFADGADAQDRGLLCRSSGIDGVTQKHPLVLDALRLADCGPDLLLGVPGVGTPHFTGIPEGHVAVADVHPDRMFGFAGDDDCVPAGMLHHGREPAAKV